MNSVNLVYGRATMDVSKAKEYKQHMQGKIALSTTKEVYNKTRYQPSIEAYFEKIINRITERSELITQLEYLERNILPETTKKDLLFIIECFQYYHAVYPVFCMKDNLKDLLPSKRLEINLSLHSPLSSFANQTAMALAVGRDIDIYAPQPLSLSLKVFEDIISDANLHLNLPVPKVNVISKEFDPKDCLYNDESVMTIFGGCDIDSAIDALLNEHSNVSAHQYFKRVYIQESAHKIAVEKLTERVNKLQWILPKGFKINDDLREAKKRAIDSCVESETNHIKMDPSFYSGTDDSFFKPLIILDSSQWLSRPYDAYEQCIPMIFIETFRTTKELVSLINSTMPFAISIWCGNSSISNEVAFSTRVGCIWINCHDYNSPSVNLVARGRNKKVFLGGLKGLLSNMEQKCFTGSGASLECIDKLGYISCSEKALKLQQEWQAMTVEKKSSAFLKAADALANIDSLKDNGAVQAVDYLNLAASRCHEIKNDNFCVGSNRMITEVKDPIGVIVVKVEKNQFISAIYAAVAAMVFGNAVILSTDCSLILERCKLLASFHLPIIGIKDELTNVYCSKIDIIKGIWIVSEQHRNIESFEKYFLKTEYWQDNVASLIRVAHSPKMLENRLTYRKIIWNTFGEALTT